MDRSILTVVNDSNEVFQEGLKHILASSHFRVMKMNPLGMSAPQKGKQLPVLFLVGADLFRGEFCAALRAYQTANHRARVVLIGDAKTLGRILCAEDNADGYLANSTSREVLIKSLDLIMLGEKVVSSQLLQTLKAKPELVDDGAHEARAISCAVAIPAGPLAHVNDSANGTGPEICERPLSSREAAVLDCLMRGESNKYIARRCQVAEATVKVHVKAILRKISAKNRTQAAIWAASHHSPIDTARNAPETILATPSDAGHGNLSGPRECRDASQLASSAYSACAENSARVPSSQRTHK